jgi:dinuclear metal center YbgI/SA1388 family protein
MLLTEFQRLIDDVFPPGAAMPGDAIGLQIESRRGTAHRVLIALELTDAVLQEAIEDQCDVVVVFHPLIYAPLAAIRQSDRVGRLVAGAIAADIAVISVHTAFDAYPFGTNHLLAQRLGIADTRALVPSAVAGYGMGLIGTFAGTFADLVERVSTVCGSPVRFLPPPSRISATSDDALRVAIVGGSGASFTDDAIAAKAEVFITADLKYHAFHAAEGHVGLIDPGHFEMEQFVPDGLYETLRSKVSQSCTLLRSTITTNPVRYTSPLPEEHSSTC